VICQWLQRINANTLIQMSRTLKRLSIHRNAKKALDSLCENPEMTLIIHYSCENLYDYNKGQTPRITSIAIKHYQTGQTYSFSIHTEAELSNIALDNVDSKYSELEKSMLKKYFKFVKNHLNHKWVHWNMRNLTYGFESLENRYKVLGGKKTHHIPSKQRYDLSKLLIEKYGENYISHQRLYELVALNDITDNHLLKGEEEANAFTDKEYFKLHQSTLRKVDILDTILKKNYTGSLKTKSNFIKIYGLTPQGIFEMIKENWLWNLIYAIAMILLGLYFGKML
jgi:hypothetical protein